MSEDPGEHLTFSQMKNWSKTEAFQEVMSQLRADAAQTP